jgi:hypothetical protein
MVPFFFAKKMPEGSTFVADECVYNNMGDSKRCREMDPAQVKLFHFTVCQKPWCEPRRTLHDKNTTTAKPWAQKIQFAQALLAD